MKKMGDDYVTKLDLRKELKGSEERMSVLMDKKLSNTEVKLEVLMDKKLNGLEEKLFAWKSEIVDAVDSMAGEIRDERDFREIISHQTADNSERIGKLEKKVFGAGAGGI